MTYTIVGLFSSQNQSKNVSKSLENKGFKNSDYIVYINENGIADKNNFITNETNDITTDEDFLIISVAIKNNEDLNAAKFAFAENNAMNTFILENTPFEKAKDLHHIKKELGIKAKILIYGMPEIKTSHVEIHEGINSEVKY